MLKRISKGLEMRHFQALPIFVWTEMCLYYKYGQYFKQYQDQDEVCFHDVDIENEKNKIIRYSTLRTVKKPLDTL